MNGQITNSVADEKNRTHELQEESTNILKQFEQAVALEAQIIK
jgi:hypothetical protein